MAFLEHKEESYQVLYDVRPPILLAQTVLGDQTSLIDEIIQNILPDDLRTLPGRLPPRLKEDSGTMTQHQQTATMPLKRYPLCSEHIVVITDRKLDSIFLNRKDFIKGKRKQKKEEKHVYSIIRLTIAKIMTVSVRL